MKRPLAVAATLAATALVSLSTVVPAHAIEYVSDTCNFGDKANCFAIFFNSQNEYGMSTSSCFMSNKDIDDHYGVNSPNGNILVLYQFGYNYQPINSNLGGSVCRPNEGSGQQLKNNAASVVNGDPWASYTVFYNSNFYGTAQTIGAYSKANLIAKLHDNNASHRRNG
ncbi:hypothetical protein GCM10009639_07420 [Kitasatospora putterlickiae]|uniref:Peptidase inhibitor family I36 n=1 Tax=Kitasatospora putterlickiae TaxID=221725 RepID=A0ABN1XLW4_9ACTN